MKSRHSDRTRGFAHCVCLGPCIALTVCVCHCGPLSLCVSLCVTVCHCAYHSVCHCACPCLALSLFVSLCVSLGVPHSTLSEWPADHSTVCREIKQRNAALQANAATERREWEEAQASADLERQEADAAAAEALEEQQQCASTLSLQPHSHTHPLTITCTCCYVEIKGTQDLKIYSHADSLIRALFLHSQPCAHIYPVLTGLLTSHIKCFFISHSVLIPLLSLCSLTHSLSLVLVVMINGIQDLKIYSHVIL